MGDAVIRRPYTEADTAYIVSAYSTTSLRAIAAHLGRSYAGLACRVRALQKSGVLSKHERFHKRLWTREDEAYLQESYGLVSDVTIARNLGRTPSAIIHHAEALGYTRKDNCWSANNVAEIFGVHPMTVTRWIKRGWIKASRAAMRRRDSLPYWNIDDESLEVFVREMPWAYDWTSMRPREYLSNIAKEVASADPWLTLAEALRELGWSGTAFTRWLKRGIVPHKRRRIRSGGAWQGEIVIRRADLPAIQAARTALIAAGRSGAAVRGHETRRAKRRSEVAA